MKYSIFMYEYDFVQENLSFLICTNKLCLLVPFGRYFPQKVVIVKVLLLDESRLRCTLGGCVICFYIGVEKSLRGGHHCI